MVSRCRLRCCVLVLAAFTQAPSPSAMQRAVGGTQPIAVRTANVDGLKLQYLTAGQGPAILLLHGYAETSRMWRPLIPKQATLAIVRQDPAAPVARTSTAFRIPGYRPGLGAGPTGHAMITISR